MNYCVGDLDHRSDEKFLDLLSAFGGQPMRDVRMLVRAFHLTGAWRLNARPIRRKRRKAGSIVVILSAAPPMLRTIATMSQSGRRK